MAIEKEKSHAKYSASASKRWLACSASVELSTKAPPQVEGPYAKEGTFAHKHLENRLKEIFFGGKAPVYRHKEIKDFDKDIFFHVESAIDEIRKRVNEAFCPEILIEEEVDLSFIWPKTFGTADVSIVEVGDTLQVIDYKHGAGVPVDVVENPQGIFYALGIAHKYNYNFKKVKIVIIQPRAEHPDGVIREWETSVEELQKWAIIFKEGILKCEDPLESEFKAGDHCRFCPAQSICPEISKKAMNEAAMDFDDVSGEVALPDLNLGKLITPKYLSVALTSASRIEKWIEELRKVAFNAAQAGTKIPGWKLVDKRSTRKWVDLDRTKESAIAYFGEGVLTEPELLSPAQFEKKFGDISSKFIERNSSSVSSGLTLVPESDKRQESIGVSNAADDFEEIDVSGSKEFFEGMSNDIKIAKNKREKAIEAALKEVKKRKAKRKVVNPISKKKVNKKEVKKNGKRNSKKTRSKAN